MPHDQEGQGARSLRKSRFPADTVIPAGATLDFVTGDTNIKITKENFLAALGVTGTLAQVGDSLAVPVLVQNGADNLIRNIEVSAGIGADISANNGVLLSNRSVGGSGISIAPDGLGNIIFSATGTPDTSNTIVIRVATDFPTPSAGVITLADNTDYFLSQDVTVSDRFAMGTGTQIRSTGVIKATLTYSGTGVMFTGNDVNFQLEALGVSYPNGTLHSVTSTTSPGVGQFIVNRCVLNGDIVGSAFCNIYSIDQSAIISTTDGVSTPPGDMSIFAITSCQVIQQAGTSVDIGTTVFDSFQITGTLVTLLPGSFGIKGATNSANIGVGGAGVISGTRFFNTGLPLETPGLTSDDALWEFLGNNKIRDTIRDGLVSIQANATETVFTGSTPTKVLGAFTVGRSSGMTPNVTGGVTYNLVKDLVVPITATVAVLKVGGGTDSVTAFIAIDGVVIAESAITLVVGNSLPVAFPLAWQSELTTGKLVEVFLRNNGGGANMIGVDMTLRVN